MVKEIMKHSKKVFMCEECCLAYEDEKWAKKCEGWCKKHNSCNLNITYCSLNREGGKK